MFLSIVSSLLLLFSHSYSYIQSLITAYGYLAVFGLMLLESATLPVPSEVILPIAGYFIKTGVLSFPLVFVAAFAGSAVGIAIDYYIGYFLGKEVVYRHLQLFHIKKHTLDSFDRWFESNGPVLVFMTRLVPVIRTVISFPAGFAKMDQKRFFLYSLSGVLIWNLVLILFGFYVLAVDSATIAMAGAGVFAIALYLVYKVTMRKMGGRKG